MGSIKRSMSKREHEERPIQQCVESGGQKAEHTVREREREKQSGDQTNMQTHMCEAVSSTQTNQFRTPTHTQTQTKRERERERETMQREQCVCVSCRVHCLSSTPASGSVAV